MTMEEIKLSEFNSNKASLYRIDKIMQSIHISNLNNDYGTMFKCLHSLRVEARYKLQPKEQLEIDEKYKIIKHMYQIYNSKQGSDKYKIIMILEEKLDDFFLLLTSFMGKKGMLLTDKQHDEGL